MKKWSVLLFAVFFISCEDDIPYFKSSIDYIYNGDFHVWKKKDIIRNITTGEILVNETRDLNLKYVFKGNAIYRSTNGGKTYDTLTNIHISADSITFTFPNNGLHKSYLVTDIFRMRNGGPLDGAPTNPRDEVNPELKGFYLFLELEDKMKIQGENSEITEVLLLYSEGFYEED